ncbi:MAG: hypothetical protein IKG22_07845, partial [Atopobiaceae bacterium]|nr:hypothetical protein [Atopobiaceae bacterium]
RQLRLEQVLELGERERILGEQYLELWIEHEGQVIEPASSVDILVETDAIDPAQSAYVEAAMLTRDETADERLVVGNLTEDENEDERAVETSTVRLHLSAATLGTVAIARVARPQAVWNGEGLEVSLLVPCKDVTVTLQDADAPQLEEGMESLACYDVQADPCPAYGTTLWLEATCTNERVRAEDELGGVVAFGTKDGALGDCLFGPEGTTELVPFRAGEGQLLLAWDSGYRSTVLSMSDVTVEGMMPEGTKGTARDVTEAYKGSVGIEDGPSGDETLAAYDITLKADGEEYQPDDAHPLTVTIANEAIAEDANLQVWHVADDGTVEEIKDLEISDGVVTFVAPGFSTYVLSVQDDSQTIPLSTSFKVRATAKGYGRTANVMYVDDAGHPLYGTETGVRTISYTGSGSESNETNTIDLYSFVDTLDPAIRDEYEFSRVYVQLAGQNQKDFRFIQVGDDTAIGGTSTSTFRAYFHMVSVAQNASGQDYNGTWYNIATGGNMNDVYIEFYHVGEPSFYALDTRDDPVPGAVFALYTDPACYVPLEYKNEEVVAVSNKRGLVSFGKIPQGTYYMKETVVPEGYKKTTAIHEVVVDGQTTIPNVIHEDDDGSVIIADVLRMTLTKEWDDGREHANDQVDVAVYANGEVVEEVTLSAQNDWTQTIDGLDPNEAYMVSETCVTSNGANVTNSWIPQIEYTEKESHAEYYKADEFRKDKQYVIVTTTQGGTRALNGSGGLTTTPLQTGTDGAQITGEVTDGMLWNVESLTKDGVIALRNMASGGYLNRASRWTLSPEYPVPLYVRHLNNAGTVKFYHRPNINNATSNYLFVWFDGSKEGAVDNYAIYVDKAATFDIYRKVNVRSVDVTITNKGTRYPILVKNVSYPRATALPGMTYDLYAQEDYGQDGAGTPLMSSLVAGEDGYLRPNASADAKLELSAGTYVLSQTGNLQSEGYMPLTQPVRFTITRGGALRVAQNDQEIADFTYSTSAEIGEATYPMLQIPNNKPATIEVAFEVEGDYADKTRDFEFALALPDGVSQMNGSIDGVPTVFDEENLAVTLRHGQTLRLEDVPATEEYVIMQADCGAYEPRVEAVTPDLVSVAGSGSGTWTATIGNIAGTTDVPARVRIVNVLPSEKVAATGVDENARAWGTVVVISSLLLFALRKGGSLSCRGKKKGHAT